jgi:hypothetical protein
MNEQKQDKILKEKLQQLQVPFDANAWAQMDVLLNKEQKKKGFIFWWLGTLGTLILISGTALYFYFNTEKNVADTNHFTNAEKNISNETVTTSTTKNTTTTQPAIINNNTIQPKNNFDNKLENNNSLQAINPSANNEIESKRKMNGDSDNNNSNNITVEKGKTPRNNAIAINKKSSKKTTRKNSSANSINNANNLTDTVNNVANNEPLIPFLMASIDKIFFEPQAMELIQLKSSEEDKESIKAPNKKKVHYSLGLSGMVAATTVGQQENNANYFFSKPYYAVGFYQEVLFGKRVAITNGIQYGKNYFEVTNPRNNTFETQPEKYTCNITMLNIPLGIKYNVVAKEKFRWYVHAGINNHIKLKENFEFLVYPPVDTTQPNPIPDPIPTNVSVQTNLSGGNAQYESLNADFSSGVSVNSSTINTTADFSINNAKRYYASAFFATGVEYILKNKWHFFVEPTYQISINAIGIQERRTQHLGVGSGIRVQF